MPLWNATETNEIGGALVASPASNRDLTQLTPIALHPQSQYRHPHDAQGGTAEHVELKGVWSQRLDAGGAGRYGRHA